MCVNILPGLCLSVAPVLGRHVLYDGESTATSGAAEEKYTLLSFFSDPISFEANVIKFLKRLF